MLVLLVSGITILSARVLKAKAPIAGITEFQRLATGPPYRKSTGPNIQSDGTSSGISFHTRAHPSMSSGEAGRVA